MAEPTTPIGAGLVAVAVAVLGPMAGEYAVIVLSALAGSLWALSRASTATRGQGALLVARLVLTAVVLTGGASWWLATHHTNLPVQELLPPVAFFIGAIGNGWTSIINAVAKALRGRLGGGQT
jgi:hypothetical protein